MATGTAVEKGAVGGVAVAAGPADSRLVAGLFAVRQTIMALPID
jgi:hypothetical protein